MVLAHRKHSMDGEENENLPHSSSANVKGMSYKDIDQLLQDYEPATGFLDENEASDNDKENSEEENRRLNGYDLRREHITIPTKTFNFLVANNQKFRSFTKRGKLYIVAKDILQLMRLASKSKYNEYFLRIDESTFFATTYLEDEDIQLVPAETIINFLQDFTTKPSIKLRTRKLAKKMILAIEGELTGTAIEVLEEERRQEEAEEQKKIEAPKKKRPVAFPYHIGEVVLVTITQIEEAFVIAVTEDEHNVTGIIQKRYLCSDKKRSPNELFQTGQNVLAEIVFFDYKKNVIELSTKEYVDSEMKKNEKREKQQDEILITEENVSPKAESLEPGETETISASSALEAGVEGVLDIIYEKEIRELSNFIAAELGNVQITATFKKVLTELIKDKGMFLVFNQINQTKETFSVDKSMVFVNALYKQIKNVQ